jgi:hypothetical protein
VYKNNDMESACVVVLLVPDMNSGFCVLQYEFVYCSMDDMGSVRPGQLCIRRTYRAPCLALLIFFWYSQPTQA